MIQRIMILGYLSNVTLKARDQIEGDDSSNEIVTVQWR